VGEEEWLGELRMLSDSAEEGVGTELMSFHKGFKGSVKVIKSRRTIGSAMIGRPEPRRGIRPPAHRSQSIWSLFRSDRPTRPDDEHTSSGHDDASVSSVMDVDSDVSGT